MHSWHIWCRVDDDNYTLGPTWQNLGDAYYAVFRVRMVHDETLQGEQGDGDG